MKTDPSVAGYPQMYRACAYALGATSAAACLRSLTLSLVRFRLPEVPEKRPVLEGLHARIVDVVTRSVPGWLAAGSEDIAQAVWLKLARQRRSEEDLAELRPGYLWRLVHSEIMDEIRRRRRRGEVGLEEDDPVVARDPRPGAEQALAGKRIGAAIRSCLDLLAESRRRAVVLYLAGHRVSEIAGLLGITRKQTENLVFRGVRDLRRHLRERGYRHGTE